MRSLIQPCDQEIDSLRYIARRRALTCTCLPTQNIPNQYSTLHHPAQLNVLFSAGILTLYKNCYEQFVIVLPLCASRLTGWWDSNHGVQANSCRRYGTGMAGRHTACNREVHVRHDKISQWVPYLMLPVWISNHTVQY